MSENGETDQRTNERPRPGGRVTGKRRLWLVAMSLAAGTTLVATLLLTASLAGATGSVGPAVLPPTTPAKSLTDGNGPVSLAAHGYYFLYVPCTTVIHCATSVQYHNAMVTLTASVANNSTAVVDYFYGSPATVIPNLSYVHGSYPISGLTNTMIFSSYLTWIYNPHATAITITFSYTAVFENNGN